ncbi:E3 ubiquitin/ISG15 ligase TRIM25-like [Ranitomeya variabilis]|uniref:E3 ubiquitin/ISG15 ligase TRIM25-like n=1 Tax=Ranitomeya variabilis TaxID=490064 RepID=UPI0040561AB9
MASAGLRKVLECSICLTLYTDPVTPRCGHSFCRVCFDHILNAQEQCGVYSCPECREQFRRRPALKRNIALCNAVETFLSSHPHQEITGICCTYCIHSPVPAVRSCLHCEASLCDNHLRVHSKSAEHVLTDPSTSLETRKCSVHKRIMEYFCIDDAACICVSCSLVGQHRGHSMEMLDEASEKKKKKLRDVLQKLITKREMTEERVQNLEEHKRKAQEKATRGSERVNILFIDIRRQVDNLEKRILSEISRQEKQESLSLSDVIQNLEIKKDELSRKMRHIEELCNMTDPLTVLQDPDIGDLCDPEEDGADDTGGHDEGDEDTWGHDGGDDITSGENEGDEDTEKHDVGDMNTGGSANIHEFDVIRGMLHAGLSDIMTFLPTVSPAKQSGERPCSSSFQFPSRHRPALPGAKYRGDDVMVRPGGPGGRVMVEGTIGMYGEGPADILLDVNTASKDILILDDLKTATWTEISENYPGKAERFQKYQVMSIRGFTSGRHYWDVERSKSWRWCVGMCYPSIKRRHYKSFYGCNNKSWALYGGEAYNNYNQYLLMHDGEQIPLPHQISSDGVRICLDYEAGQLSFYELCDPIRHLHTFTATFTEPLHAALYVCDGSIKISG